MVKRPVGRPRKFAGPKMSSGKFKSKVGLNKVEDKQVDSKIKSAIKATQTLKYFNGSAAGNTPQHPEPTTEVGGQVLKEVSVIGYSSTTNENSAGVKQKYGPQDIVPLFLSRPFKEFEADGTTKTDEKVRGFRLDAYHAMPKSARTMFSIERVAYEVDYDGDTGTALEMARTLPIMCRMIKVGFKQQAGTQQTINPNEDLFLDVRTNAETGCNDVAFTRLQCKHAKINNKKYKTISDNTFVVNQNNIISQSREASNQQTDTVTQKNGASIKYLTHNFQLSNRKGGKLFYENPTEVGAGPATSTSGGQRILLLYHFWYENAHNLTGGSGQPDSPNTEDIQIKFVNKSAFVDTQ